MSGDANTAEIQTTERETVKAFKSKHVSPLINAGDYSAADAMMQQLLVLYPDAVFEHLQRVDYRIVANDADHAGELFHDFEQRLDYFQPLMDADDAASFVRLALWFRKHESAARIAKDFVAAFNTVPNLAIYGLRALALASLKTPLISAARTICSQREVPPKILREIAKALYETELFEDGRRLISSRIQADERDEELLIFYARILFKHDKMNPELVPVLTRILDISPDSKEMQTMLSSAYAARNVWSKSLTALNIDRLDSSRMSTSEKANAAEAFLARGDYEAASAFFGELAMATPHHVGWNRSYVTSLMRAGRIDEAREADKRRLSNRWTMQQNYADFRTALDDLENHLFRIQFKPSRVEWAWQRLTALNAAPPDRQKWIDQCKWACLADELSLDWMEGRPDETHQIFETIGNRNIFESTIRPLKKEKAGVILCPVHVGPLYAPGNALAFSSFAYKWLIDAEMPSTFTGAEKVIGMKGIPAISRVNQILKCIRRDDCIYMSLDGGRGDPVKMPFIDASVYISNVVPRIIHQTQANSIFWVSYWQDKRVFLDMRQLPSPYPGQSVECFTMEWLSAYSRNLADMFQRHPENMRFSGGFWDLI